MMDSSDHPLLPSISLLFSSVSCLFTFNSRVQIGQKRSPADSRGQAHDNRHCKRHFAQRELVKSSSTKLPTDASSDALLSLFGLNYSSFVLVLLLLLFVPSDVKGSGQEGALHVVFGCCPSASPPRCLQAPRCRESLCVFPSSSFLGQWFGLSSQHCLINLRYFRFVVPSVISCTAMAMEGTNSTSPRRHGFFPEAGLHRSGSDLDADDNYDTVTAQTNAVFRSRVYHELQSSQKLSVTGSEYKYDALNGGGLTVSIVRGNNEDDPLSPIRRASVALHNCVFEAGSTLFVRVMNHVDNFGKNIHPGASANHSVSFTHSQIFISLSEVVFYGIGQDRGRVGVGGESTSVVGFLLELMPSTFVNELYISMDGVVGYAAGGTQGGGGGGEGGPSSSSEISATALVLVSVDPFASFANSNFNLNNLFANSTFAFEMNALGTRKATSFLVPSTSGSSSSTTGATTKGTLTLCSLGPIIINSTIRVANASSAPIGHFGQFFENRNLTYMHTNNLSTASVVSLRFGRSLVNSTVELSGLCTVAGGGGGGGAFGVCEASRLVSYAVEGGGGVQKVERTVGMRLRQQAPGLPLVNGRVVSLEFSASDNDQNVRNHDVTSFCMADDGDIIANISIIGVSNSASSPLLALLRQRTTNVIGNSFILSNISGGPNCTSSSVFFYVASRAVNWSTRLNLTAVAAEGGEAPSLSSWPSSLDVLPSLIFADNTIAITGVGQSFSNRSESTSTQTASATIYREITALRSPIAAVCIFLETTTKIGRAYVPTLSPSSAPAPTMADANNDNYVYFRTGQGSEHHRNTFTISDVFIEAQIARSIVFNISVSDLNETDRTYFPPRSSEHVTEKVPQTVSGFEALTRGMVSRTAFFSNRVSISGVMCSRSRRCIVVKVNGGLVDSFTMNVTSVIWPMAFPIIPTADVWEFVVLELRGAVVNSSFSIGDLFSFASWANIVDLFVGAEAYLTGNALDFHDANSYQIGNGYGLNVLVFAAAEMINNTLSVVRFAIRGENTCLLIFQSSSSTGDPLSPEPITGAISGNVFCVRQCSRQGDSGLFAQFHIFSTSLARNDFIILENSNIGMNSRGIDLNFYNSVSSSQIIVKGFTYTLEPFDHKLMSTSFSLHLSCVRLVDVNVAISNISAPSDCVRLQLMGEIIRTNFSLENILAFGARAYGLQNMRGVLVVMPNEVYLKESFFNFSDIRFIHPRSFEAELTLAVEQPTNTHVPYVAVVDFWVTGSEEARIGIWNTTILISDVVVDGHAELNSNHSLIGGDAVSVFSSTWSVSVPPRPDWLGELRTVLMMDCAVIIRNVIGGVSLRLPRGRGNAFFVSNSKGLGQRFVPTWGSRRGLVTSSVFTIYGSTGRAVTWPNAFNVGTPESHLRRTHLLFENVSNYTRMVATGKLWAEVNLIMKNVNISSAVFIKKLLESNISCYDICDFKTTTANVSMRMRGGAGGDEESVSALLNGSAESTLRRGIGLILNASLESFSRILMQNVSTSVAYFGGTMSQGSSIETSFSAVAITPQGSIDPNMAHDLVHDERRSPSSPPYMHYSSLSSSDSFAPLLIPCYPFVPHKLNTLPKEGFDRAACIAWLDGGILVHNNSEGISASSTNIQVRQQEGLIAESVMVAIQAQSCAALSALSSLDNASSQPPFPSYSCLLMLDKSTISSASEDNAVTITADAYFGPNTMLLMWRSSFTCTNRSILTTTRGNNGVWVRGSQTFALGSQFSMLSCRTTTYVTGAYGFGFTFGIFNGVFVEVWGSTFVGGGLALSIYTPLISLIIVNNTFLASAAFHVTGSSLGSSGRVNSTFMAGCNRGVDASTLPVSVIGPQLVCSLGTDETPSDQFNTSEAPSSRPTPVYDALRCASRLSFFADDTPRFVSAVPRVSSLPEQRRFFAYGDAYDAKRYGGGRVVLPCHVNAAPMTSQTMSGSVLSSASVVSPSISASPPSPPSYTMLKTNSSAALSTASRTQASSTSTSTSRATTTMSMTPTMSYSNATTSHTILRIAPLTTTRGEASLPSFGRDTPTATLAKKREDLSHTLLITRPFRYLDPIPAPLVSEQLRASADRSLSAVGVVVAASSVVSVNGGQLGVANALLRMSKCEDSDDNDNSTSGNLPILVHPLRFSIGAHPDPTFGPSRLREEAAYAGAALSNTVIIPAALSLAALGPMSWLVARMRGVSRGEALTTLGWPSLLVLPFSTLAEGIGLSVVRCLTAESATAVAMGAIALLSLVVFTGGWLVTLYYIIPRGSLQLIPSSTVSQPKATARTVTNTCARVASVLVHVVEDVYRSTHPTAVWSPAPSLPFETPPLERLDDSSHVAREGPLLPLHQGESFREESGSVAEGTAVTCRLEVMDEEVMERYAAAIGDKRFYVAEILSFGCSVAVGVAEGLTPRTEVGCRSRAVCVLLLASIQCCCSVCSLVPAELWLQCLLSLCIVPLGIGTTVRSWGQQDDENGGGRIDAVLISLSLVINVLGFLLMLLSLFIALRDFAIVNVTKGSASEKLKPEGEAARSLQHSTVGTDDANNSSSTEMSLIALHTEAAPEVEGASSSDTEEEAVALHSLHDGEVSSGELAIRQVRRRESAVECDVHSSPPSDMPSTTASSANPSNRGLTASHWQTLLLEELDAMDDERNSFSSPRRDTCSTEVEQQRRMERRLPPLSTTSTAPSDPHLEALMVRLNTSTTIVR